MADAAPQEAPPERGVAAEAQVAEAANVAAAAAAAAAAVVSSSDHNPHDSSDEEHGGETGRINPPAPPPASTPAAGDAGGDAVNYNHHDPHYDENQDDEDEAWVYRHMRGGCTVTATTATDTSTVATNETSQKQQSLNGKGIVHDGSVQQNLAVGDAPSGQQMQNPQTTQNAQLPPNQQQQQSTRPDRTKVQQELLQLKPRNSDAVLSCPCCFTIVCMDCQRHIKYNNQFRAMFVMNIGVKWDRRLTWDKDLGELVEIGGGGGGEAQQGQQEGRIGGDNDAMGRAIPVPMDNEGDAAAAADTDNNNKPVAIPIDESRQMHHHHQLEQQQNQIGNNSSAATATTKVEGGGREKEEEIYYSVYCASCYTEVAYLDMNDEVYHFINCVASG